MAALDSQWRKSTRSGDNGACVEVAEMHDEIKVRDSKDPDGPKLTFTRDEWRAFVTSAKDGDFDR